jgi:hypothetical protein
MLRSAFVALLLIATGGCIRHAPPPATMPATRAIYPIVVVPPVEPQKPMDNYIPGVRNFGFISADVWRGAKPSPVGFTILKGMGIRTVIDLQELDESKDIPEGVLYVPLRTSQWKASEVDTAAVLRAIEKSPKPVYIHCLEGRDRTGVAIAAYRLSRGMKVTDAIAELNNFRVNFWWRGPMERRIRQIASERASAQ